MSLTESSNPLFRVFKNSRRKYYTVKYKTLNNGKKRVPTFDCSRVHSDQFAKFSIPKIRTLIKLMSWSKRDLCDELEQELITANHSKLDQAFRKSRIDPDDGNNDDFKEQFDTLMVYFLDEIDGRNNAGNIVLNSCKPPALSFDDVLKKYGDQMDCKPSDVLGRVLTTRELALKVLAIADGTEPSDETNKRDYFFIFNKQARYWFENEYREGGPYDYYSMDEIAAGMDVYFKKKIDAIKEANRNQGKKRKYDDEKPKIMITRASLTAIPNTKTVIAIPQARVKKMATIINQATSPMTKKSPTMIAILQTRVEKTAEITTQITLMTRKSQAMIVIPRTSVKFNQNKAVKEMTAIAIHVAISINITAMGVTINTAATRNPAGTITITNVKEAMSSEMATVPRIDAT